MPSKLTKFRKFREIQDSVDAYIALFCWLCVSDVDIFVHNFLRPQHSFFLWTFLCIKFKQNLTGEKLWFSRSNIPHLRKSLLHHNTGWIGPCWNPCVSKMLSKFSKKVKNRKINIFPQSSFISSLRTRKSRGKIVLGVGESYGQKCRVLIRVTQMHRKSKSDETHWKNQKSYFPRFVTGMSWDHPRASFRVESR